MKRIFPLVVCAAALALTSCATERGSATPGYWTEALPGDPGARFGLLIEVRPIVIEEGK